MNGDPVTAVNHPYVMVINADGTLRWAGSATTGFETLNSDRVDAAISANGREMVPSGLMMSNSRITTAALAGFAFVRYLNDKYGDQVLPAISRNLSSFGAFTIDGAIEKATVGIPISYDSSAINLSVARVVDGSGAPPFHADVGTRNGRIADIGKLTGNAPGDHQQALVDVDLGRSQPDARRRVHGFRHVRRQTLERLVENRDGSRNLVKARVGVSQDVQEGHLSANVFQIESITCIISQHA